MLQRFSRSEMLIGQAGQNILKNAAVVVFGIGGVGSYAAEAIARSGVGNLVIIDHDQIHISNINRQIHALTSTVGRFKVDVMKERILDINPECHVITIREFMMPDNVERYLNHRYCYVIDAIDYVPGKIAIIKESQKLGLPVISAMGTGNKLDPKQLKVADISQTSICPLARAVRRELKKAGILSGIKVVFSSEKPTMPDEKVLIEAGLERNKGQMIGSIAFVPPVAGLIMAGEVINDLLQRYKN
jgi:tRNA A37 threonylcarbamoyladenosine dehydratase